MLQSFGVEEITERIYRAMLEAPAAGVAELAQSMALPPAQVRAELDRLAELTLVEPGGDEGRPDAYLALPPEQALEVLIAREEERLLARQREMAATRTAISELVDSFVDHRRTIGEHGLIEQIEGARVVRSRLFQLSAAATGCAMSMMPGEPLSPKATEASARLDRELLARGVSLRTIVSEVSVHAAHWRDYLESIQAAGAQVRTHPAPPSLAVVIDATAAVIPREGDEQGALVVHGAALVAPIRALFEEVWHDATPLVSAATDMAAEDQITEARVRQVVTLLAQGQKDETIARRMGVSVRTVRRLVSAAIDQLQAQSRFQAGVLAVQRGWVRGPGAARTAD